MTNRRGHLSAAHPLAQVAARHCAGHLGSLRHTGIGPGVTGVRLALSGASVRGILAGLADAIALVHTLDAVAATAADDETAVA